MCSTGQEYPDCVSDYYVLTKYSVIRDKGERGLRLCEGTIILFIWRNYDKPFAMLN